MSTSDELRRDFDASFARAAQDAEPRDAMLALRIGGEPYMIPLGDVANVTRAGVITPAPSSRRELVGIAAVRGRIVAVFDLAALLGAPSDAERAWLVLAQNQPIAFAVAVIDGYVAVPRGAVVGSVVSLAGLVEKLVRKET